jgi:hypothetical protein
MSGAGHQATLVFQQSMTYFEPLYERLQKRQLEDELKVGGTRSQQRISKGTTAQGTTAGSATMTGQHHTGQHSQHSIAQLSAGSTALHSAAQEAAEHPTAQNNSGAASRSLCLCAGGVRSAQGYVEFWVGTAGTAREALMCCSSSSPASNLWTAACEVLFAEPPTCRLSPQVGLWMLVQHMRDRNYLAANDIYLKLAIGNAPWPIGEAAAGCLFRSNRTASCRPVVHPQHRVLGTLPSHARIRAADCCAQVVVPSFPARFGE